MELKHYMKSINNTKSNIINEYGAEKDYPPYIVSRMLSYHLDCIMTVNELNIRGLSEFGISNKMHYQFFLYELPKANRFSNWKKPLKDELIEMIIEHEKISYNKAKDIANILSDEEKKEWISKYKTIQ